MLKFDNPFSPTTASAAGGNATPLAGLAGSVYAARRGAASSKNGTATAPSSTIGAGRREAPRAGRRGFSIDPARIEAYRRRSAGCMGMAEQADKDRRNASSNLAAQERQARRFIDERTKVPDDLAARIRQLQAESDAAEANYAAVSNEIQSILSVWNPIEKYVDERKADNLDDIRKQVDSQPWRDRQEYLDWYASLNEEGQA